MQIVWLYFQVPYTQEATKMRLLLGLEKEGKLEAVPSPGVQDIPHGIEWVQTWCSSKGISLTSNTVFIYPHDERHGLAWPVKEQADKLGCAFSRQIPEGKYPNVSDVNLFCAFENGRPAIDPAVAQDEVMELNAEAKEDFSSGDMLPVMTKLRFALDTSLHYFGWTHPITYYTIRNLMYSFQGTGNPDNIREGDYLARKLVYEFTSKVPSQEEWSGSEMFFEHISDVLSQNGYSNSANAVLNLPQLWSDRR